MTSFFLFPFNPYNFAVNTKLALAVLGAGVFFLDRSSKRDTTIPAGFLGIIITTAVISVWTFFVITVRETNDYSYTKYVVSALVWISAAYFIVWLIKQVNGEVNLRLISLYLVGVCIFQCVLAYLMTLNPGLKSFIDTLLGGANEAMGIIDGRLYGLGAALDPAGLRFAAVLVLCADLIVRTDFSKTPWTGLFLFLAFIIISVLGNMISRSTTIGMAVGILYIIVFYIVNPGSRDAGFVRVTLPAILLIIVLSTWLYNTNPDFQKNLRFGFEGFFSLVEKGRWEVHSNEILKTLVVWPENLKTWIIGDGFFMSPLDKPDMLGQVYTGYYMHTDIGYIRYIFYFGVIGLLGMIVFFAQMTIVCVKVFDEYKWIFILLFVLNCIGWAKVSSDLIMVFAPFIVLAFLQKQAESE